MKRIFSGVISFFATILKKFQPNNLRGISLKSLFEFPKKPYDFSKVNFSFGVVSVALFGLLFFSSPSLAQPNYSEGNNATFFNSFFKDTDNLANNDLFFSQTRELALETPDLKIIQDNSIHAVTTPSVLTTQTLGDIFGGSEQSKKDVTNYTVAPGDTIDSVAQTFNISTNTLLWANDLTKGSSLKVGQSLTILPVSGVLYIVKNGDTIGQIAQSYKVNVDDIISFNNLANQGDIFIGDTLIVPGGVMSAKVGSLFVQVPLADNFFIYPAEGNVSQGLHYYNGVDVANKCGTPVYAAASGVVQRVIANGGWNLGMGNYVTILHSNGTVTYYGHFMSVFVKSGDRVAVGDRIGLMGKTGSATGCHVHFEVIGAQNPLAKFPVGSVIKYKQ